MARRASRGRTRRLRDAYTLLLSAAERRRTSGRQHQRIISLLLADRARGRAARSPASRQKIAYHGVRAGLVVDMRGRCNICVGIWYGHRVGVMAVPPGIVADISAALKARKRSNMASVRRFGAAHLLLCTHTARHLCAGCLAHACWQALATSGANAMLQRRTAAVCGHLQLSRIKKRASAVTT